MIVFRGIRGKKNKQTKCISLVTEIIYYYNFVFNKVFDCDWRRNLLETASALSINFGCTLPPIFLDWRGNMIRIYRNVDEAFPPAHSALH